MNAPLTFPNIPLVSYLRQRRDDGLRLVVVSDSYLCQGDLRSLFEHHQIDDFGFSSIYTSSDCGTGKGVALWEHVVTDLGVAPDEIVHVGDNYEADVVAAQRTGLYAVHLPVSTERFSEIVVRERIVGDAGEPSHWCDEWQGDGGMTAVRRRATLLPAPSGVLSPDEQVTWETGTAVFGPVFTGFAQWVHEQSAALGAERALCVMREGRFLKRLLDGAPPIAGHHLVTQTIWASREACARASIYDGSRAELQTFLNRASIPTPRQLMSSLGLDPVTIPELAALLLELDGSGLDDQDADKSLIDFVVGREELVRAVLVRSRLRRLRLVAHLRAAAGPGPGPVTVVDVGWGGTIIESLQRMLTAEGDSLSLHGLYLLAHIGSAERILQGIMLEGYLGDSGSVPFDIAGITGNPELLELACMCDEGSLLEIGDGGEPVLAPRASTPLESERRALMQDGIVAFQVEWLRQRDQGGQFESSRAARVILRRILERFLSQPNQDEAASFAWWTHEENFGSTNVERLVPNKLLATLGYQTAESLHARPMNELYWVGGAAALVDAETADSVLLMRRGEAGPGRFSSSSDVGAAGIMLCLPDGSELTVAEIPISLNRRGLSLVEWEGDVRSAVGIHLRPTQHPAILRLDRLEVVFTDPMGAVVGEHTWEPANVGNGIVIHRAMTLADRTYVVDKSTRFEVTLPSACNAHSLSMRMGGAYLPVPDIRNQEVWPLPEVTDELAALRQQLDELLQTKLFRTTVVPRRIYGALRRHLRRLDS